MEDTGPVQAAASGHQNTWASGVAPPAGRLRHQPTIADREGRRVLSRLDGQHEPLD